jgi:hypothetical protein
MKIDTNLIRKKKKSIIFVIVKSHFHMTSKGTVQTVKINYRPRILLS